MNSSRLRWAVPAGVTALIGAAVLTPSLASAGVPQLPVLTPAQLLAAAGQAHVDGLSGTIRSNAELGLPSLSQLGIGSGSGPMALAGGRHTLRVWVAGEGRQRVALDDSLGEYDLVRRDRDVWTYDSSDDTVTHASLPARPAARPTDMLQAHTPQEMAAAVLAAVRPSTTVRVARNVRVAHRSAYELVLTPKDSSTLVGSVRLALDARTKMPLRVQVFARKATSPALSVGFSKVRFGVPAASVFRIPTGKALVQAPALRRPAGPPRTALRPTVLGEGWDAVLSASGVPVPADGGELLNGLTSEVTVKGVRGHLFRSALVTALVLDDGRAFVGAVTTKALTATAARS